jgi:hypothetical protein
LSNETGDFLELPDANPGVQVGGHIEGAGLIDGDVEVDAGFTHSRPSALAIAAAIISFASTNSRALYRVSLSALSMALHAA